MSANLELLCAFSPDDEEGYDVPLFDFSGVKKLPARLAGLCSRVAAGLWNRFGAIAA